LLAQLVTAGFGLFGLRNRIAAILIEGAEVTEQCSRVSPARTQLFFHQFQVAPDELQIKHDSIKFN
jgi:hypothetical protein